MVGAPSVVFDAESSSSSSPPDADADAHRIAGSACDRAKEEDTDHHRLRNAAAAAAQRGNVAILERLPQVGQRSPAPGILPGLDGEERAWRKERGKECNNAQDKREREKICATVVPFPPKRHHPGMTLKTLCFFLIPLKDISPVDTSLNPRISQASSGSNHEKCVSPGFEDFAKRDVKLTIGPK